MSLLGGLVVGLFNYIAVLYTVDTVVLQMAAPQWPIIIAGGFAGLAGSILDSILGATLQYSGEYKISYKKKLMYYKKKVSNDD